MKNSQLLAQLNEALNKVASLQNQLKAQDQYIETLQAAREGLDLQVQSLTVDNQNMKNEFYRISESIGALRLKSLDSAKFFD